MVRELSDGGGEGICDMGDEEARYIVWCSATAVAGNFCKKMECSIVQEAQSSVELATHVKV